MAEYVYQDAVTGQFVTEEYAKANPRTTYRRTLVDKVRMDNAASQDAKSEQETDSRGDLYHDDKTMLKVHEALKRAGVTGVWTRTDIITEIQNAGILFRERGKF